MTTQTAPTYRPTLMEYGVAGTLFTLVAAVYCFPAIRHFSEPINRGDYLQFAWNFWWLKLCALHGWSPAFTHLQFHPTGTSLAFHDMTYHWALLSVPLQVVLTPIQAMNLFIVASFALNGLTTHWFLRRRGLGRVASFVGGFVFTFSVHRMNLYTFGEINSLGSFYIPLALHCLLRIFEDRPPGRRRNGATWGLGLFTALTFLCSWYNGIFLAIALVVAGLWQVLRTRRIPLRRSLAALAVFLVVMTPFVTPMALDYHHGVIDRPNHDVSMNVARTASVDLLFFGVPDATVPSVFTEWAASAGWETPRAWVQSMNSVLVGHPYCRGVYLGLPVLLALALACVLLVGGQLGPRTPLCGLMLCIGFVGVVYALGPDIHILGKEIMPNPLYRGISRLPFLNVARAPARMAIVIMFAAGGVCAVAVDWLGSRISGKNLALAALLFLTLYGLQTKPSRHLQAWTEGTRSKPFFKLMATDHRTGTVLDVPVDFQGSLGPGYVALYQQMLHHKPIVGGMVSREDKRTLRTLYQSPLLTALHHKEYMGNDGQYDLSGLTPDIIRSELQKLNVDYIVVHRRHLGPHVWDIATMFMKVYGRHIYADDHLFVYRTYTP